MDPLRQEGTITAGENDHGALHIEATIPGAGASLKRDDSLLVKAVNGTFNDDQSLSWVEVTLSTKEGVQVALKTETDADLLGALEEEDMFTVVKIQGDQLQLRQIEVWEMVTQ